MTPRHHLNAPESIWWTSIFHKCSMILTKIDWTTFYQKSILIRGMPGRVFGVTGTGKIGLYVNNEFSETNWPESNRPRTRLRKPNRGFPAGVALFSLPLDRSPIFRSKHRPGPPFVNHRVLVLEINSRDPYLLGAARFNRLTAIT